MMVVKPTISYNENGDVNIVCSQDFIDDLIENKIDFNPIYINLEDEECSFVETLYWEEDSEEYNLWIKTCAFCEEIFNKLSKTSGKLEASTVLTRALKRQICIRKNFINDLIRLSLLEYKNRISKQTIYIIEKLYDIAKSSSIYEELGILGK